MVTSINPCLSSQTFHGFGLLLRFFMTEKLISSDRFGHNRWHPWSLLFSTLLVHFGYEDLTDDAYALPSKRPPFVIPPTMMKPQLHIIPICFDPHFVRIAMDYHVFFSDYKPYRWNTYLDKHQHPSYYQGSYQWV